MLSIAVCDDEVIECCSMAKRMKEIMEEMKIPCIIRQFRSGGELLQALESFDVVFLDIIMQELDGMKTAQILRERASDKILIFVSSSREYVFEAYDVEAFQYLLKPVEDRKLKSVLQKAVHRNLSLSAGKGRKRSYFLMIYTLSGQGDTRPKCLLFAAGGVNANRRTSSTPHSVALPDTKRRHLGSEGVLRLRFVILQGTGTKRTGRTLRDSNVAESQICGAKPCIPLFTEGRDYLELGGVDIDYCWNYKKQCESCILRK